MTFPPAVKSEVWTVVFAPAVQTQSGLPALLYMNHIVCCNALYCDMWPELKVNGELFILQSMKSVFEGLWARWRVGERDETRNPKINQSVISPLHLL